MSGKEIKIGLLILLMYGLSAIAMAEDGLNSSAISSSVVQVSGSEDSAANESNQSSALQNMTTANGAGGSIGQLVWEDMNANGILEAGEPGLPGFTVKLYDESTNTWLLDDITDPNGNYLFDSLADDRYYLIFLKPDNYHFSPRHQGNDPARYSDPDEVTGKSSTVAIEGGNDNLTINAGLWRNATIGGVVWLDLNANGIREPGEPGIANAMVMVYRRSNDLLKAACTTGSDGSWRSDIKLELPGAYLPILRPDIYYIRFVLQPTYKFSPKDQGGNDATDSDPDPMTGCTDPTTLVSGEQDLTWNAGMTNSYPPATPRAPVGISKGFKSGTYTFSTSSLDQYGNKVLITFDWGDGSTTQTQFVNSGSVARASHRWQASGIFHVLAKATNSKNIDSLWSETKEVTIINRPPTKPTTPSGPRTGTAGTLYTYSTSSRDPDGDQVKYIYSWGDGLQDETGYMPSGMKATFDHKWTAAGTYEVTVQTEDIEGAKSSPSGKRVVRITA